MRRSVRVWAAANWPAALAGSSAGMGEFYRKKALQYVQAADTVRDPAVRIALLNLARNYLALADYIDRQHERGAEHHGEQDEN